MIGFAVLDLCWLSALLAGAFVRQVGGTGLSLAISVEIAYTPLIRTIDLLVDRAEPAPLPKTSLKSDVCLREGRAGLTALLRILEKLK